MKLTNIGGYGSIDAYVAAKLEKLASGARDFGVLFELMFSEGGNVMYERSAGYRVEKITYAEAKERSLRRAKTLAELLADVPADSVVGLHMENGVEWIETMWAILAAGHRPLLMNLRLDAATLERALADADARAVVTGGRVFTVRSIPADAVVPADAALDCPRFGSGILVMSSGTSDSVKICVYTAEEFYWQISDSAAIIRESERMKRHVDGELKQLAFLPFYHIFGLAAVYVWFAFFARTFVHLPDLAPSTIQNTVRRHKVTHVFAVPLFWNRAYAQAMKTIRARGMEEKFNRGLAIRRKLARFPRLQSAFSKRAFREVRDNMFGDSVQFMITGGSEISPRVLEFFNAIGYHLADGYGMTEIGVTSVELSEDPRLLDSCSVGRPLSSVEYKLNADGELLVKSTSSAKYIIEGGAVREREEWFNTRDLAEKRGDRWYILGRRDDVVVSPTGENLNPNLIEPRFAGVPGVNEAALVGVKSGGATEPVLVVSCGKYASEDELEKLREALRGRISELGLASQIKTLLLTRDPLIADDEFKLNRRRIAARCAAGSYTPADAVRANQGGEMTDPLSLKVRDLFAGALGVPADAVTADFDFFADGGGTSLDYFAMLAALNEEFGTAVPASGGSPSDPGLTTVRRLSDRLRAELR